MITVMLEITNQNKKNFKNPQHIYRVGMCKKGNMGVNKLCYFY